MSLQQEILSVRQNKASLLVRRDCDGRVGSNCCSQ